MNEDLKAFLIAVGLLPVFWLVLVVMLSF
jgi:hypothetical protein